MEKFDFVILGAGSAGCVLANRLSKDPNFNVCLIEAGSKDSDPRIHIPIGFAFLEMEVSTVGITILYLKKNLRKR